MVHPLIFAACDAQYYADFAPAFVNSARAHGHDVQVFCDGGKPAEQNWEARALYCAQRFLYLPHLLEEHPAVLVLDVDSVIQKPIDIEPEYDLGVFLCHDAPDQVRKVAAGMFYVSDRAMHFARAVEVCMRQWWREWGADQRVLWHVYQSMAPSYNVKIFDRTYLDWEPGTEARVYTGKGQRKNSPEFKSTIHHWSHAA